MRLNQPTGSGPKRRNATLFLVALLATGFTLAGTLGEFIVGVLAPVFERELDVSGAMVGQFIAVMFIASAMVSIPAGRLTDTVAPPKIALVQILMSAIAFGSFALAQGVVSLFVSSALVGVSMSLSAPLANRVIVTYLPYDKQAVAIGWRSLGPQIASVIIGAVFAITGNVIYWRVTVVIITCLLMGFALLAFILLARRGVEVGGGPPRHAESCRPRGSTRANPLVWWLIPYTFFSIGVITSIGAYLLYFGTTVMGLPLPVASFAVSLVSGVSIAARIIWLRALTRRNLIRLLMISSFTTAASAILMVLAPRLGVVGFWGAAIALGVCGLGATPIPQVAILWNTNPIHIGSVSAGNGLAASLGLTMQPLMMSLVVERFGVANSWFVVAACAALAGGTMVLFRMRAPL